MNLLAIDPGAAQPGPACAYFSERRLVSVGFAYHPGCEGLQFVVVERPEQQGDRSRAARPRDLMALSWAGAMAAGYACGQSGASLVEYTPSEWKGTEPKPIHHWRLWRILTPGERMIVGGEATRQAIQAAVEKGAMRRWGISGADCYPRSFKTHNILDAVALGCFHMRRSEKR